MVKGCKLTLCHGGGAALWTVCSGLDINNDYTNGENGDDVVWVAKTKVKAAALRWVVLRIRMERIARRHQRGFTVTDTIILPSRDFSLVSLHTWDHCCSTRCSLNYPRLHLHPEILKRHQIAWLSAHIVDILSQQSSRDTRLDWF